MYNETMAIWLQVLRYCGKYGSNYMVDDVNAYNLGDGEQRLRYFRLIYGAIISLWWRKQEFSQNWIVEWSGARGRGFRHWKSVLLGQNLWILELAVQREPAPELIAIYLLINW